MIQNFKFIAIADVFKGLLTDEKVKELLGKIYKEKDQILNILFSQDTDSGINESEIMLLKRAWSYEELYTVEFKFDECVNWFKYHLNVKSYGSPALLKYKTLEDGELLIQVFLVDNELQLGNSPIRIINTSKIDGKLLTAFGNMQLILFK